MKKILKRNFHSKCLIIVVGAIILFLVIVILSITRNQKEEGSWVESPIGNNAEESITTNYSIKDVKADEKYFSATVFIKNVNKENVVKVVKEIKYSNYSPKTTVAFELFFFDDEDIAKKYLRVTNEESAAFDKEIKAMYVKMNNPPSETLEVLGQFIDIKNLDL